jgi:hypothetical protein
MGLVANTRAFCPEPWMSPNAPWYFLDAPIVAFWAGDELCWAREYLQWLSIDDPKKTNRNFASAASLSSQKVEASCLSKMQ